MNTWGILARMSSMNLWKVWSAFFSPKGILRNSHSPKGKLERVPRVLGRGCRVLGRVHKVLGRVPRVLGRVPRVLGRVPRVLGRVPRVPRIFVYQGSCSICCFVEFEYI